MLLSITLRNNYAKDCMTKFALEATTFQFLTSALFSCLI